jgi:hypothetical protein
MQSSALLKMLYLLVSAVTIQKLRFAYCLLPYDAASLPPYNALAA